MATVPNYLSRIAGRVVSNSFVSPVWCRREQPKTNVVAVLRSGSEQVQCGCSSILFYCHVRSDDFKPKYDRVDTILGHQIRLDSEYVQLRQLNGVLFAPVDQRPTSASSLRTTSSRWGHGDDSPIFTVST